MPQLDFTAIWFLVNINTTIFLVSWYYICLYSILPTVNAAKINVKYLTYLYLQLKLFLITSKKI